MTKSTEQPRSAMRPTEYIAPLIVVLLVVLGITWYLLQVWQRVDQRPVERESLNLRLPGNAPKARE